jgi:hypothetical protein
MSSDLLIGEFSKPFANRKPDTDLWSITDRRQAFRDASLVFGLWWTTDERLKTRDSPKLSFCLSFPVFSPRC